MWNQKGITLVTLVITIIVLIILAGISINTLVGENGIITKSKQTRQNIMLASDAEQRQLNLLYESLNNEASLGGEESLINDFLEFRKKIAEAITERGIQTSETDSADTMSENIKKIEENQYEIVDWMLKGTYANGNTKIKDVLGNELVIPDGFKIANDSGITVEDGIVIEDNDLTIDGNGKNRGNQFVWIPVGNVLKADGIEETIILGRYTFDTNGTEILGQTADNYVDETIIDTSYKELVTARISSSATTNTTAKDIKGFIDSVKKIGGYYIARYEASYRDGVKPYSKVSVTASTSSTQTDGKLWNNITQPSAAKASRAMYSNQYFETDLVNSYAWDTAISYIQKCSEDIDYSKQISLNKSMLNTGKTGDEKCKINDMSSNMEEWSTEYTNTGSPCTSRGGLFSSTTNSAAHRHNETATASYNYFSFRVILYLQYE